MSQYQKIPLLQVGQGRIGGPLRQRLASMQLNPICARLDPQQGLLLPTKGMEASLRISQMVVCVASSSHASLPADRQWQTLFYGLQKQVSAGQIIIEKMVFVSSTRVFDGVKRGLITADTPPLPASTRAKAIREAETTAARCTSNLSLLRCGGLYGADYRHYEPIMRAAKDRPRTGTCQQQVVDALFHWCTDKNGGFQIRLLTDGQVYWQGKVWESASFVENFPELVARWPILIASEK